MNILMLLSCLIAGEPVTYAAGYIPNVQFAPFYVAQSRGYYQAEGLEVTLDYTIGPEVFKLVAVGKIQMGSADSDAFLHASVRRLPLVHLATLYQNYPIALIAHEDILTPAGLKGKRIGITGTYGSSYLGLKAILAEMKLALSDVNVVPIGYTQVPALSQKRVDAVVGYVNNEPVRLNAQGHTTHTRSLTKGNRIPGVGMMANATFYKQKPEVVKAFLRATFKGMHDVITDPETCYAEVVESYLPELKGEGRFEAEYKILLATLPFWTSAYVQERGYGQCNPKSWQNLADHLEKDQGSKAYKKWAESVDLNFHWKPE